MKFRITKHQSRFYGRVALAYLGLWTFIDLVTQTNRFFGFFVNEIWRTIFIAVVMFLFFERFVPWVRLTLKRMIASAFILFGFAMVFSWGLYTWRGLGIRLGIHTSYITYENMGKGLADQMGASMFALFFFGVIRHAYNYRKLKEAAQQLKIEKQAAELNYLKSQTNPHFLFNTLNNIYSLARDKSDQTPEAILRLSKILRFMLYETSGAYISIEEEMKIIQDYIALEKLRYDASLRVDIKFQVENLSQPFPPLLLIPLVENAFKHGVSETRGQPFVEIKLLVVRQQLEFEVRNSLGEMPASGFVQENIGLTNLRRQLELLYTDFSLVAAPSGGAFSAILKINLASHV